MAERELLPISESSPLNGHEELEERLGPQHRLFCYEYLVDFNHRRAAEAVNLPKSAGLRLLRIPDITKYLKILTDELATESIISRDMVQHELLNEFLPRAKGEKEIHGVDRDGAQFTAKITNMAAYGKGLDMMAKHSGFTLPEVTQGGLTININHKALGITIEGESEEVDNDREGEG